MFQKDKIVHLSMLDLSQRIAKINKSNQYIECWEYCSCCYFRIYPPPPPTTSWWEHLMPPGSWATCRLPKFRDRLHLSLNIHKYRYSDPHKSNCHQNKSTARPQLCLYKSSAATDYFYLHQSCQTGNTCHPDIHKYKYSDPHKSNCHQNKSMACSQLGVYKLGRDRLFLFAPKLPVR